MNKTKLIKYIIYFLIVMSIFLSIKTTYDYFQYKELEKAITTYAYSDNLIQNIEKDSFISDYSKLAAPAMKALKLFLKEVKITSITLILTLLSVVIDYFYRKRNRSKNSF